MKYLLHRQTDSLFLSERVEQGKQIDRNDAGLQGEVSILFSGSSQGMCAVNVSYRS